MQAGFVMARLACPSPTDAGAQLRVLFAIAGTNLLRDESEEHISLDEGF